MGRADIRKQNKTEAFARKACLQTPVSAAARVRILPVAFPLTPLPLPITHRPFPITRGRYCTVATAAAACTSTSPTGAHRPLHGQPGGALHYRRPAPEPPTGLSCSYIASNRTIFTSDFEINMHVITLHACVVIDIMPQVKKTCAHLRTPKDYRPG